MGNFERTYQTCVLIAFGIAIAKKAHESHIESQNRKLAIAADKWRIDVVKRLSELHMRILKGRVDRAVIKDLYVSAKNVIQFEAAEKRASNPYIGAELCKINSYIDKQIAKV